MGAQGLFDMRFQGFTMFWALRMDVGSVSEDVLHLFFQKGREGETGKDRANSCLVTDKIWGARFNRNASISGPLPVHLLRQVSTLS